MEVVNAEVVRIEVRGRKAMNRTPEIVVVGDNSGYKVRFDFDELWADTTVRTAIFVFNRTTVAVPFEGNECDMPPIVGATMCEVGVTAGDIITTVPAYIPCELSIKGVGGKIEPPTEDVYAKIVSMIEAGMLKGEKGDKGDKGEKGDAGSIKFIPVVKLPDKTDPTIDTSAIYVEPLEKPDEKNKYGEYIFVNGDWEKLGEITIEVDHSDYVKFTDFATNVKAGVVKVGSGVGDWGIGIQNGFIYLGTADKTNIENRNGNRLAITPVMLNLAVKEGVTTNTETLSEDSKDESGNVVEGEKTKACKWLGALKAVTSKAGTVRAYVIQTNGTQGTYNIATTPAGTGNYYIALYLPEAVGENEAQSWLVSKTPTKPYHTTTKKFVEDNFVSKTDHEAKIAELQAQIDALKGQS